jgi:hypothetical protein
MCINWPVTIEIMVSIGLLWESVRLAAFNLAMVFMWQYVNRE